MVTKRDDRQPTDRVNIEQSASGRLEGRVLQYHLQLNKCSGLSTEMKGGDVCGGRHVWASCRHDKGRVSYQGSR